VIGWIEVDGLWTASPESQGSFLDFPSPRSK
jgi:hypothetical protein